MKPPIPSKEQQVLFNLLKGDPPKSLEGIDIGVLFDLFRRHRLFPIATAILSLLEEGERERWKRAIQFRTLRSMQQLTVCHSFVEAFRKEGLEAIPFKGPVLAHILFGNVGARHSSDLDILVRNEDTKRIIELAEREGFELKFPKAGLSERQWRYYRRYKKDIGLHNKEHRIFVELHYSFENYLGLSSSDMDLFIQHTEEVRIGELRFPSMNKHYTFLYLALHGGVHQYRRLFWLRDVAEALISWELDHQKILADAKAMGIERLLGISMELAKEIFSIEIPEEYKEYLQDNRRIIGKLKQTALGYILGPEFPSFKGKMSHHLFMLRLKPELSHYFRTMREIVNRLYIGKFLGGH